MSCVVVFEEIWRTRNGEECLAYARRRDEANPFSAKTPQNLPKFSHIFASDIVQQIETKLELHLFLGNKCVSLVSIWRMRNREQRTMSLLTGGVYETSPKTPQNLPIGPTSSNLTSKFLFPDMHKRGTGSLCASDVNKAKLCSSALCAICS